MKIPALTALLLGGALALSSPLAGAPRASISGALQVGQAVSVKATGGKATAIRWEHCLTTVRANRCSRVARIGSGRTLVIPAASGGKQLRAVMRIRGKAVRTRFSRPVAVAGGSTGGGSSTSPAVQLVIPAGWVVTGSAATIPFAAGATQAQKDAAITTMNAAYAAIAAQVKGGRVLFFSESLGNGGLITEITLTLCTQGSTFVRRTAQSGLGGGGTTSVSGTWAITLDLTQGVAPTLVLTDGAGTQLRDAIDPVDASRVKLGNNVYTTGPSTTCG